MLVVSHKTMGDVRTHAAAPTSYLDSSRLLSKVLHKDPRNKLDPGIRETTTWLLVKRETKRHTLAGWVAVKECKKYHDKDM